MVDARDEGELGVRKEGGGGKDHPGFYSLEEGFMEDGKDFMEGDLDSQPESLQSSPSLSGCGPGTATARPVADTLPEETQVQGRF